METKTFDDLILSATKHLQKMSYSALTIDWYLTVWRGLGKYMARYHLHLFTGEVGTRYIEEKLGSLTYEQMTKKQKYLVRAIKALVMYHESGQMKRNVKNVTRTFDGNIGLSMLDFLHFQREQGISPRTIDNRRLNLHRFLCYLDEERVFELKDIGHMHLFDFIDSFPPGQMGKKSNMLSCGKVYFRYLFDMQLITKDLSRNMSKNNFRTQSSLPSTYSDEEIERLLSSIDRANPKGKRDYAMMLLASRLGLRSSDICHLRFEEIHWEENKIILTQRKTGDRLELPLLPEIGEAIIDYLKFGRPVSKEPYVFLHVMAPYQHMTSGNVYLIAASYFRRSGVDCQSKKHGPHALRHSLARILLNRHTPIPVISGILGHKSNDTTSLYLRIGIDSLKQCSLNVPAVSNSFYEQKGGYCYE